MVDKPYSVRPHMFAGERTYTLDTTGLAVTDGKTKTTDRIPYRDIDSVRLITYASFDGAQHQSTIRARSRKKVDVRSHHFVSTGNFEDRSAAYAQYVRALCSRVHVANPSAKFIWGSRGLKLAWLVVLVIAVLGWMIWALALYEGVVNVTEALGAFAILVLATALGSRSAAANFERSFDPLAPPVP